MQTMYKVQIWCVSPQDYKIEEIEILKETNKMIVYKTHFGTERKVYKKSQDARYFDTFAKAEQFLFSILQKSYIETVAEIAKLSTRSSLIEKRLETMIKEQ